MERIVKFENLKKLAKDNNYKHIALISPDGIKMVNFNPADNKITFEQNLVKIQKKLNSPVYPPGKYKILLVEKISRGFSPDEFYIFKNQSLSDNSHTDLQSHNNQPVIIHQQAPIERALSFEKAIELNGELANLRAERLYLLEQIKNLQDEVHHLENELDKVPETKLEESPNSFISTLKEYAPSIMAYLDKSLQIKERELQKNETVKPIVKKPITIGSNAHLQLIDFLYKRNSTDEFYKELEKLSKFNTELYYLLLEKYNLNQQQDESENERTIDEN